MGPARATDRRLLTLLLVGFTTISGRALADPPAEPPAVDPATRAKAIKLYEDGIRALKQQKIEEACSAFRAAFSLQSHYQIAGKLGECELELGKARDAAEHLAFALEEPLEKTPAEQRARLDGLLQAALGKVVRLKITVDADPTEILVNDRVVGTSPLARPVFAEPGSLVIRARPSGANLFPDRRTLDATAGMDEKIVLSVHLPASDLDTYHAPSAVETDSGPAGARSLSPLAIGGGIAAVALGAGIGFHVAAGGAGDTHDLVLHAAVGCYIGAGAAAAGGVLWYFLQPRTPALAGGTQPSAMVTPHGASVGVTGRW